MISVLVLAFRTSGTAAPSPGEAVRTLSSLVPAVVEGIVRDVALVAVPPHGDLAHVADHAGCALVEGNEAAAATEAAARQSRCRDVLIIQAGVMIERPFLDELCGLMPVVATAEHPTAYVVKCSETGLLGRVFPSMAHTVGLLTRRDRVVSSRAASLARLVRASGPAKPFKTRVWAGI